MMYTKTFATLALFVAAALAAPAPKNVMKMPNAMAASQSMGAIYFLTNEADRNFIVSADIGSNGQVTLARAVATSGRGQHGTATPQDGPDGLFSQASIKASQDGKIVAAVNPGSNTASVFAIDQNQPSILQQIGEPASTEGEFPMSLAINKAGDKVCVLNGGAVNGVNCFSVDKTNGLVPMPNTLRSLGLNQTTPASGPAGSASQLLFSEDEKTLIASVKGTPPTPGFLALWAVADDGSLSSSFTQVAPPTGGGLPFSMTLIAGKNALLATDPAIGFETFDLSNVTAGGDSSQVVAAPGNSAAVKIDGQSAVCWSQFSTKTGNFYLSDIGTAMITEVNVDDNLKGTVVKQYPQTQNSGTIDTAIATINNKDFLYVLGANATQIDVLSLDAPGQAKGIQTLDISGPAKASGLTVSPSNLQGMAVFIKN